MIGVVAKQAQYIAHVVAVHANNIVKGFVILFGGKARLARGVRDVIAIQYFFGAPMNIAS